MSATVYTPSAWGKVYHALPHHEALGAGSAGPGKTQVLIMDPVSQIVIEHNRCLEKKHPYPLKWGQSTGWALHLRRELPMLEQTLARAHRIFPNIDPDVKYNSQNHTFTFKSGYRLQYGHCRDPDSWQIYFSNEYTHIGFDELVQFEEEQYEQITGRLRSTDPVLSQMLKVRSMSNPFMRREGNFVARIRDPNWVRKRFVDPAPEGKVTLRKKLIRGDGTEVWRTRIYLPATLYDNPDKDFVKQYEETLLDKPAHIRAAMLYGDWYVTAGSYYGESWNDQYHVCKPFNIPDSWPRFRTMDWGFKSPGVVLWWAMDEDENLFCEREVAFQGKDATTVARDIIKAYEQDRGLWVGGKSAISGAADPQLWEERGERGKTKAQEMADVGVSWMRADRRGRTRNAQRLLSRLADHKHGTQTAGVVFFQNCRMCRQTLPAIQADMHDPESPQDGGDDHWHDAVLYAMSFASHGRAGIPPRRRKDSDSDWHDEERKQDRGRYGYGNRVL